TKIQLHFTRLLGINQVRFGRNIDTGIVTQRMDPIRGRTSFVRCSLVIGIVVHARLICVWIYSSCFIFKTPSTYSASIGAALSATSVSCARYSSYCALLMRPASKPRSSVRTSNFLSLSIIVVLQITDEKIYRLNRLLNICKNSDCITVIAHAILPTAL